MFFRWLYLYAARLPWLFYFSFFWLLGILAGHFFSLFLALSLVFLSTAFLLAKCFLPIPRLLPVIFSLAVLRSAFAQPALPDFSPWPVKDGQTITLSGAVKTPPAFYGNAVLLRLAGLKEGGTQKKFDGEIEIVLPSFPIYAEGDQLQVAGALFGIPPRSDGTRKSRVTSPVFGRLYYPKVEKITPGGSFLSGFFLKERRSLAALFTEYLPEPEASLAAGVVLGNKAGFPRDFTDNLRRAGLMHVVVVSGFNISLLIYGLTLMTGFLGKPAQLVITLLLAAAYAFLCGGGWPVWRAVLMAAVFLLSKITGREKDGITVLFFSAALLTLADPSGLTDISFQLSFLATFGLLFFCGPLADGWRKILPRRLHHRLIVEGLAATLAAQIATFPILAGNFGQISLVSPLANFLIFAIIPYIMGFSLVLLLTGLFLPGLASLAAVFAYLPLAYFVRVAGFLGQFTWSMLRF